MKYKFVDKAKKLTPEDIKAQMNFDNVVKGASIWAGFKLGSAILKLGSKVTASVVAGTSTVVVTAAVVVATNTDLLKSNSPDETSEPATEIVVEDEKLSEEEITPKKVETTPLVAKKEKKEEGPKPKVEQQTEAEKAIPKPLPQKTVSKEDIIKEDIVIDASPLPNLETFLDFIDRELKYPVEEIAVNSDSLKKIEGYVEVFFTVNREGKANNFKVRKSLGLLFDNEAIRVLRKYQNWAPASYNGEAVESNLKFKVHFKVK